MRKTLLLFANFLVASAGAHAGNSETAVLLSEIIRINTSNPPGNEKALDELLAAKFKPLGFETEIIPTPDPAKAHFFARLKGDGSAKPIVIAAHADVVGVEREKWTFDPFAGTIKDGFVYGRGALDFKGGLAVFAQAAMRLAQNKVPLKRDIIFLSEADEEGGKYNTMWLADSHWDKMDCEFALNEGGWIMKNPDGSVRYVSISTADKSGVTLLVTAHGTSTHSSMPQPDNAIFRLARAMAKLSEYDTKPRLIPSTREFFLTLAKTSQPPLSTYFENLVNSTDPAVVAKADKMISENTLLPRYYAEHNCSGVFGSRISRQRNSGIGYRHDQFPDCSRHHVRRTDRRNEKGIRRSRYRRNLASREVRHGCRLRSIRWPRGEI